ncbi:POK18 protein, partial [Podargus strigoides]|nr:POK18 protein [Podargus strigoides]
RDVCKHWLTCFAVLGVPRCIKTDSGPAYCSARAHMFLHEWGVSHTTGIPHSPTGQAIIEHAHLT